MEDKSCPAGSMPNKKRKFDEDCCASTEAAPAELRCSATMAPQPRRVDRFRARAISVGKELRVVVSKGLRMHRIHRLLGHRQQYAPVAERASTNTCMASEHGAPPLTDCTNERCLENSGGDDEESDDYDEEGYVTARDYASESEDETTPVSDHHSIESERAHTTSSTEPPVAHTHAKSGIRNIHNNCYISAILQLLSAIDPFIQLVRSQASSSTQPSIIHSLNAIFEAIRGDITVDPTQFLKDLHDASELHEFKEQVGDGEQHDASEILRQLTVVLGTTMTSDGSTLLNGLIDVSTCNMAKCERCGHISIHRERHPQLLVDVLAQRGSIDLSTLVSASYNRTHTSTPPHTFRCDYCFEQHGETRRMVYTTIDNFPPILLMVLKRGASFNGNMNLHKVEVQIPMGVMDMSSCATASTVPTYAKYKCVAIVQHKSSVATCGHYVALVKRKGARRRWLKFDDHDVSEIDETQIEGEAAYVMAWELVPRGMKEDMDFGSTASVSALEQDERPAGGSCVMAPMPS